MAPNRRRHSWMAIVMVVSILASMRVGANHDDDDDEGYRADAGGRSAASVPAGRVQQSGLTGDRAADHAIRMIGKPYRYGGNSPSSGFDCSGLVQFSYKQAGATLPRTTDALRQASAPLRSSGLRRGDLVFFDQEGKKNGHVGIYLGAGEFIHAPSSGGRVRKDSLQSPYWRKHFSEARRISA
jgi:murein DD-endopeptidase